LPPPGQRSAPWHLGIRRRCPRVVGHRRAGFPDELDARIALRLYNDGLALCVITDPRQRTAGYLRDWPDEKELRLKPTTMAPSWLRYYPAEHSVPPEPRARQAHLLNPGGGRDVPRHNADEYADEYAGQVTDLFEVILGTGMGRGEVLALYWSDVHLMDRRLLVRWTLAAVNNNGLAFGRPKTEASRAWSRLSPQRTGISGPRRPTAYYRFLGLRT
jgi:hypothetical protein